MKDVRIVGGKYLSAYLIPLPEGYCLIDTGARWAYDAFTKRLAEQNVSVNDIKYIVLTHVHSLHAGFLKHLLLTTQATLVYDVRDKMRLEAGKNNLNTYVVNFLSLAVSKLIASLLLEKTQCFPAVATDKYEDAKTQPLSEYGIEFVFLRGHTEYDVCVKYGDKLFCGDLCSNGLFSSKRAPVWIYNKYELLSSWRTILSMPDVKTIYPDFGAPFPKSDLVKSLDFWRTRGVFKM